jgi:hypothetical protein
MLSRSSVKTGYAHHEYAASLCEFGTPRYLPRCDGWILEREIPSTPYRDAIGAYPLFSCRDWSQLEYDLEDIGTDLVSLMLVPAPFDPYNCELLNRCFDRVIKFKPHYVADLTQPIEKIVKKSHRAAVGRAQKKVEVHLCPHPSERIEQWMELFSVLVNRHNITGIRAFSREAFDRQLCVPGMVMFEACVDRQTVGLDLWYVQDDVAYGHLVAFNDLGYQLRASYATKWYLLQYFSDKVRWLDLGGGAGTNSDGTDSLSAYKQGWSTGTVPAYVCCRVFDQPLYDKLATACGANRTNYFPAYRSGEPI